jgi:UDPglucose 6-dehydrogenase
VAVGTPPAEDGSADLTHVEAVAHVIGREMIGPLVVVNKSTVPIGTGRRVNAWIREEQRIRGVDIDVDVVSNPEFLREGSAVQDFMHPDRVVIGCDSKAAAEIMRSVYRVLYINETPFIETNIETAEMIKYACNAYLALKITFINEVANLCEQVGANVQDVAHAMGKDGRISPKFLHSGPGYGGSCFPKDTKALADIGRKLRTPITVVEAAIQANEAQKHRMVAKIDQVLHGVNGKTLAILGLAFKPNTDDMRDAPSLTIVQELVKRGARVVCYDPVAMPEARWRLESCGEAVQYVDSEYLTMPGADALVLLTEWNQFRNLDFDRIKCLLKTPIFFDLRNVYKRKTIEMQGFHYEGVGQ